MATFQIPPRDGHPSNKAMRFPPSGALGTFTHLDSCACSAHHYERGNGRATPQLVDSALRKHMPRYDKRLSMTQFKREQIFDAVSNAELKRAGCKDAVPAPGMTDVRLPAKKLIGEE